MLFHLAEKKLFLEVVPISFKNTHSCDKNCFYFLIYLCVLGILKHLL